MEKVHPLPYKVKRGVGIMYTYVPMKGRPVLFCMFEESSIIELLVYITIYDL